MVPIPGPKARTDADLKEEAKDWNRKFAAIVLPFDEDMVTGLLTGVGIIAVIVVPPLLCSLISALND